MPYKCIRMGHKADDTADILNVLETEGWRLVCSYAAWGMWLILYKEPGVNIIKRDAAKGDIKKEV